MKFYECAVCKNLNGVWRIHCQVCGAIPSQYSMTGKTQLGKIVAARGCLRAEEMHVTRVNLRTVTLDYYAGA